MLPAAIETAMEEDINFRYGPAMSTAMSTTSFQSAQNNNIFMNLKCPFTNQKLVQTHQILSRTVGYTADLLVLFFKNVLATNYPVFRWHMSDFWTLTLIIPKNWTS